MAEELSTRQDSQEVVKPAADVIQFPNSPETLPDIDDILKVTKVGGNTIIENVAHWGQDKGYSDAAGKQYNPDTLEEIS